MLLVIDIGNTNTVLGIFDSEKLIESWRLSSSTMRTVDESWVMIKLLCNTANLKAESINGVAISSVVPCFTTLYVQMARKFLSLEPVVVDSKVNLGLKILCKNPAEVGADRLCNAVAGKALYPLPQIIIDLGTATTFDVLTEQGDYLGGAIAPGLDTASDNLIKRAAKLQKIDLEFPKKVIGTTTKESLQSGIMIGHKEMISGMVRNIKTELQNSNIYVVLTGGFSEPIKKHSPDIDAVNPLLTLEGLRLISSMNA